MNGKSKSGLDSKINLALLDELVRHKSMTINRFRVFLLLASYAEPGTNEVKVTQRLLSMKLEISVGTVNKSLRLLESFGVLIRAYENNQTSQWVINPKVLKKTAYTRSAYEESCE